MPARSCGEHCPSPNRKPEYTQKCRICASFFHLLCYDIPNMKSKLFVSGNIVFICDECLGILDRYDDKGPDGKRKKPDNAAMIQSVLSSTLTVKTPSQQSMPAPAKNDKPKSNDKIQSLLTAMAAKLDLQAKKLDHQTAMLIEQTGKLDSQTKEIGEQSNQIDQLGQAISVCTNEATATFKFVKARKEIEHERFPKITSSLTNEMENKPPNGQFGGNRRTYSTVVQSKLPVTPQSQTPSSSRKREKTLSLIHNATGETVQSVKFPSPKQGKKEVQIGLPVSVPAHGERQRLPRNINPMTKAIWVSKFHPSTEREEIENYIVNNTDAKDKTKFKCTMLVKKDADVSSMSYVSYKIDVTPEVYDILIDPVNWPKDKQVREFVKLSPPRRTLKEFVISSPSTSQQMTEIEKQNAAALQTTQQLGIIPSNRNSNSGSNETTMPKNSSTQPEVHQ